MCECVRENVRACVCVCVRVCMCVDARLQFPDEFMSVCAVKWTRRRQALAVEASRTLGDALMQLPRHCRVSPPAPTYTDTNSTTTTTQAGASTTALSLSLSLSSARRVHVTRQQRSSRSIQFGFIYLRRATWDFVTAIHLVFTLSRTDHSGFRSGGCNVNLNAT